MSADQDNITLNTWGKQYILDLSPVEIKNIYRFNSYLSRSGRKQVLEFIDDNDSGLLPDERHGILEEALLVTIKKLEQTAGDQSAL